MSGIRPLSPASLAAVKDSRDARALFEQERALGQPPDWAIEIVERMIDNLPMCGHYTFPQPVLSICRAIRQRACPAVIRSHYTADPERKRLMSYYVYCLDAWLNSAALDEVVSELSARDGLGRDWPGIARAIYKTLEPPSERKRLLVQRLVHRQRWWIKTLIWPGDARDRFGLDAYLGDARGDEADCGAYGNSPHGDPYFAELRVPAVQELSAHIRGLGDGELLGNIEHSHLCAPKAFRYLEKTILAIGCVGCGGSPADQSILQCEDLYPDFQRYKAWYDAFMCCLQAWLRGNAAALDELGDATPVSRWLGGVLHCKLGLFEVCNPFGRLVGRRPAGKSGTQAL